MGDGGFDRDRFLRLSAAFGLGAAAPALLPCPALADDPLHCAPPPGNATAWTGDTRPIVARRDVASLDAGYRQKLASAYAKMRALPESDPRSFVQQANVHGWYCGGCGDNKTSPLGPVHYSWKFFLWHRAYLYFHERILGHLVGDPNFRLVYWDWSSSNERTMPSVFTTPANATNALWNATRAIATSTALPENRVGPSVMNALFALGAWGAFGGDAGGGGAVESQPHNFVHATIEGDMGAFSTAGRDPIFYAHHTNIDRTWATWQAKSKPAPDASMFGNAAWTFYDENKTLRSIKPSQVIDHRNSLRYSYDTGASVPSTAPHPVGSPIALAPGTPVLQVPADQRAHALLAVRQGRRVALALRGIAVPASAGVFTIEYRTPGTGPRPIGYVAVVPDSQHGHAHVKARPSAAFEVTEEAARLLGASGATLALAPASARAHALVSGAVPLHAAAAQLTVF